MFAQFGETGGFGTGGEFERLTRQYWDAWGQALRGAVPSPSPSPLETGIKAWQDALQWWRGQFAAAPVVGDTVERFGQQAGHWYAQMQQVAAQFAGRSSRPADVVAAWKAALGNSANTLFSDLLDTMAGRGMQGMGEWLRGVQPVLDALKHGSTWLNLPAVGFTREHQQRLKALALAQWQVQQAGQAYNELLLAASQSAFERFERALEERAENGQQPIQTPRALFDVWVDAAEQAYAEVALSEDYRRAYAELANAQMRLRGGIQREIEQVCAQLGMPTRSELDSAHRKIVELERALRQLQEGRGERETPTSAETPAPAAAKPARRTTAGGPGKPRAAKSPARKPARKASASTAGTPRANPDGT